MSRKRMYTLIIIDALILLFLFLASSTDWILKEQAEKVHKVTIVTDTVRRQQDENFRIGINKGAVDKNMDTSMVTVSSDMDTESLHALLQKEWENGAEGLILSCSSQTLAEEITDSVPIGMPVVIWDTVCESPRVRSRITVDAVREIEILAEEIQRVRKQGETVIIVELESATAQIRERHETLEKALRAAGILVRWIQMEDISSAETAARGLAAQGGNILASADLTILEALAAGCQKNQLSLLLFGTGWQPGLRSLLEQGYISGLVVQQSYEAGYLAVAQMAAILKKEGSWEERQTVVGAWITPENMYDKGTEHFLFPYA